MVFRASTAALLIGFFIPDASLAGKKWEVWENCRLIPNKYNDGDSFKVRKESGNYTYILRLYFVDAPESDDSIPKRVTDQAAYWEITEEEAIKIGKEATRFTADLLKDGFTVFTRKEKAMGRSKKNRYYAMIKCGDQFLANALIENGYARFFGKQVEPPDKLPNKSRFRMRLKGSEKEAKQKRLGAWGISQSSPSPYEKLRAKTAEELPTRVDPPKRNTSYEVGEIQTIVRSMEIYSSKTPGRRAGTLHAGAKVKFLKKEQGGMLRIRFKSGDGKVYESLCLSTDFERSLERR